MTQETRPSQPKKPPLSDYVDAGMVYQLDELVAGITASPPTIINPLLHKIPDKTSIRQVTAKTPVIYAVDPETQLEVSLYRIGQEFANAAGLFCLAKQHPDPVIQNQALTLIQTFFLEDD